MNSFELNTIMEAYVNREGITQDEMMSRLAKIAETVTEGVDYSNPHSAFVLDVYKSKNPTQYEELKSNPILLDIATSFYNKEAARIRKLIIRKMGEMVGITDEADLAWMEKDAMNE